MSAELMQMFYHSHAGSWFFTILLFLSSYILLRRRKLTQLKFSIIMLRVFFVIMVSTGIGMLIGMNFSFPFVVKGVFAIILITLMEMILARARKGKETRQLWLPVAGLLPLIILMGFNVISF